MKKDTLFIIACLISIAIQAQSLEMFKQDPAEHLKFMGIELTGSISSFHKKLLAKGLTVSPKSKEQPVGVRTFDGTFSGEKAEIIVWYDPQSKEVYRANAIISRDKKNMVEQLMENMENKLDMKYGTNYKVSEEAEDDDGYKFTKHVYVVNYGTISMFITSMDYEEETEYLLHLDYQDSYNTKKSMKSELDDL